MTTASPVIAQPSSPSAPATSPTAPQDPAAPVEDPQQDVAGNDDPAAVVEDLPPIAPETSLPAAPPPADADTRSDGSEPVSEVPTARSQARTTQTDEEWEPTEDPNATVVPGQMRSDREEIPEGFTKEEADRAETMEARLQGEGGGLRALVAPGCQVYWPAPYEVCGAIRDKYNALGGPNSFLLFPKTNELTNPDGYGKRTEFVNGPIYWSPQGGAHPVVNHFLAAWARHGYEASYIGYPTTDEIVNPDGIGRRQHFTGSTIYWRLNEAYSVGGAIQDKWNSLGAERGQLGYPIEDERVLPDGQGRMNRFEKGVIYWHPTTGAHQITGEILDFWSREGYERSSYGYPVGDPERIHGDEAFQAFQHRDLETPLPSPIENLTCSELAAQAAKASKIDGAYDFVCSSLGVIVQAVKGDLTPTLRRQAQPGQPYGQDECAAAPTQGAGPARVNGYRVTKSVSLCFGRITEDPSISWGKLLDMSYVFAQQQRRYHSISSSISTGEVPGDLTIDTEFRVREDLSGRPDRTIAQEEGNFVQATPGATGSNNVNVDGKEGTYFAELTNYNISIPSWGYKTDGLLGSSGVNMGRMNCPYYRPPGPGDLCAWTDPFDDHL